MIRNSLFEETELEDENPESSPLDPFFAEGVITEIIRIEKSGKEGTVYCCRAAAGTGYELLAVKVYRPRTRRNFKNDSVYKEGRVILNQRTARAVANKSGWGREAEFGHWMGYEFEALTRLHALGSDVPRPIRAAGTAILMEYIGDEDGAATKLREVALEPHEVRPTFNRLLANVELWLAHDLVHGDLSPYNVLYWDGRLTVIDFPQAVDPRANHHAYDLLRRDIDNICKYWSRYDLKSDSGRITDHLWGRFVRSEF